MPPHHDTHPERLERLVAAAQLAAEPLDAMPLAGRADLLRALADALTDAGETLVPIAHDESSLPVGRLEGELARTTGQLRLFADVIETGDHLELIIDPASNDSAPARPDLRRMLVPLGPVAVFSASNFPFAFSVAGGDTASALAAGCPVVVKANPGHPRLSDATSAVLAKSARTAGAPDGTIAVVHGLETGRRLVTHPSIRAVGFTGSPAGGRALFDLATSRPDPIPFYGELGSINPVIITQGAASERADAIADGLVESFTLGTGQFCTKPGIVFVPSGSDIDQRVVDRLDDTASPMLTDRIASDFHDHIVALDDAPSIRPMTTSRSQPDGLASPRVYTTTVAEMLTNPELVFTERFGPVTILVTYDDLDELSTIVAAVPGSLTVSLHGTVDEHDDLRVLARRLTDRAGRIVHDGWPTGVAVTAAMHHGGPWPATTAPLHTSVGTTSIRRWLRPVAWQDAPDVFLPPPLQDSNPLRLLRRVDGTLTRDPVAR